MTAMTATAAGTTRTSYWLTAAALVFATIALAAWLVGRIAASDTPAGSGGHPSTGQYNQLCVPAPGTRFC